MSDLPPIFDDLDKFYPGSRTRRPEKGTVKAPPESRVETLRQWTPRTLLIGGREVDFVTIGALAASLNRQVVTIRQWELRGQFPKARFRDKHGRRLYPVRVVERVVTIAQDAGILDFDGRPESIPQSFTQAVIALWKEPV